MRHYEVVFLINPTQTDQVSAIIDRYKKMISDANETIHRFEDWGRRQLAYPINKIPKAHYVLMNIECSEETLENLKSGFRFNDAIIRSMIIRRNEAITEPSIIKQEEGKRERHPSSLGSGADDYDIQERDNFVPDENPLSIENPDEVIDEKDRT